MLCEPLLDAICPATMPLLPPLLPKIMCVVDQSESSSRNRTNDVLVGQRIREEVLMTSCRVIVHSRSDDRRRELGYRIAFKHSSGGSGCAPSNAHPLPADDSPFKFGSLFARPPRFEE